MAKLTLLTSQQLEYSVSINFWTDTDQTGLVEELFAAIPTTEQLQNMHLVEEEEEKLGRIAHWSPQAKLLAASDMFLDSVFRTCPEALRPLVDESTVVPSGSSARHIFLADLVAARYQRLLSLGTLPCPPAQRAEFAAAARMRGNNSQELANLAQKACSSVRALPAHTLTLWFGNWAEALAASAVGPDLVGCALGVLAGVD